MIAFQRRSPKKRVSPGFLDISASGHVPHGRKSIEVARSELFEELGIKVSTSSLVRVGRRIDMYEAPGVLSRVFADVYFVKLPGERVALHFDPAELAGVVLISTEALRKLVKGGQIEGVEYYYRARKTLSQRRVTLTIEDFIPRQDNLYERAALAAERFISGASEAVL